VAAQRIFRDLIETGLHKGLPKCVVEGCNHPGQHTGNRRIDGSVIYRPKCDGHHRLSYDMNGGYRLYKKDYCENIDGRLGFKCTTSVIDPCMLDVDHIDHVHENNSEVNLQTLCSCCHNYKTRYFDSLPVETIRHQFTENKLKFTITTQPLCD
jgi:hypothetical protein